MKKPRRKQVRDETFKLFKQEGLEGWKVKFNGRLTRALGRCIHSRKTIEYQVRYIEQNDYAEVLKTVQHEVAHAVAGAGAGHGAKWVAVAKRLGLENPSATSHTATLTKKFTGRCPKVACEFEVKRDRRCKASCPRCGDGFYSPKLAIIWTRN